MVGELGAVSGGGAVSSRFAREQNRITILFMASTPEEADVVIEWPDGQRWQGRVFPALSEYAPSEWLGSGFERAHARKLSPAEREAMLVQIADATSEFRMCMARKAGPLAPGAPRVDVRVIRGRAGDTGDERVLWLSPAEVADRMRALAGELAALEARLSEAASSRYATVEDQRAALLQAGGYVEASLGRWSRHLEAEAERVAGRDDGTAWTSHRPDGK